MPGQRCGDGRVLPRFPQAVCEASPFHVLCDQAGRRGAQAQQRHAVGVPQAQHDVCLLQGVSRGRPGRAPPASEAGISACAEAPAGPCPPTHPHHASTRCTHTDHYPLVVRIQPTTASTRLTLPATHGPVPSPAHLLHLCQQGAGHAKLLCTLRLPAVQQQLHRHAGGLPLAKVNAAKGACAGMWACFCVGVGVEWGRVGGGRTSGGRRGMRGGHSGRITGEAWRFLLRGRGQASPSRPLGATPRTVPWQLLRHASPYLRPRDG